MAPTSSLTVCCRSLSLGSEEADDTEPASMTAGSQCAGSTGASDMCCVWAALFALVVFLAVRGPSSSSEEELEEELTA